MGCGVSQDAKSANYIQDVSVLDDSQGVNQDRSDNTNLTSQPHFPYEGLFQPTKNSNQNYVFVETLRAYLHPSEAKKPKKIISTYTSLRQYDDDEFPAEVTSLCNNKGNQKKYESIEWKTPEEIYPDSAITVFTDAVGPLNVKQGKLQNCYFVSALSCIAEKDGMIASLFPEILEEDTTVNAAWINDGGEWVSVITDNYFPCDPKTRKPVFSNCNNPETWVLVLEKSYAKVFGSYDNIEYGMSSAALRDLTGAPYEYYSFDDSEEAWQYLATNYDKKYLITANSKEAAIQADYDSGITPGHCYSVLELREIDMPNTSNREKLLKVRNPWGKIDWNGDWSRSSNKWTPELMKQLGFRYEKDDGTFWINIQDFIKVFSSGAICKIHEYYRYSSLKIQQMPARSFTMIHMKVKRDTHSFITISQKDRRHFINNPKTKDYKYSLFSMMILKVSQNFEPKAFVTGYYDKDRDCEVDSTFEEGSYSQEKITFTEVVYRGESTKMVEESFRLYFKNSFDPLSMIDYGQYGQPDMKRYIKHIHGYLVFYYQNNSKDSILQEQMMMSDLEYLHICPPFTDDHQFSVTVQPGNDKLVLYKTDPAGDGSYKYKIKFHNLFLPDCPDSVLKQTIIERHSKVSKRSVNGSEIEVYMYTYKFKGGVCLYYVNNSPYVYMETNEIKLENMVNFNGIAQSKHTFTLKPNRDHLIKLRAKDIAKSCFYQCSINFKVFQNEDFSNKNFNSSKSFGSDNMSVQDKMPENMQSFTPQQKPATSSKVTHNPFDFDPDLTPADHTSTSNRMTKSEVVQKSNPFSPSQSQK